MKPADFLLGLMDFFAILLPGAITAWLAAQYVDPREAQRLLTIAGEPLPAPSGWAAFLLASYLLGHLVFMAGAALDPWYDRWRRRTKPRELDRTFRAAQRAHERLHAELAGGDLTTFKWAKCYVQLQNPAARLDIDRLEASQKLFRSLVVISAALAAHFLLREGRPGWALAAAALAVGSYRRYVDQRWKATELTYATAAILGAPAAAPAQDRPVAPRASEAGEAGER